jgi:uncharacterized protein YjiS (DUF1127 family)
MSAMRRIHYWIALIRVWRRRAHERWMLAGMSERALKDIGITRWEARSEASKPFWRP